jgi:hypothetical protein
MTHGPCVGREGAGEGGVLHSGKTVLENAFRLIPNLFAPTTIPPPHATQLRLDSVVGSRPRTYIERGSESISRGSERVCREGQREYIFDSVVGSKPRRFCRRIQARRRRRRTAPRRRPRRGSIEVHPLAYGDASHAFRASLLLRIVMPPREELWYAV